MRSARHDLEQAGDIAGRLHRRDLDKVELHDVVAEPGHHMAGARRSGPARTCEPVVTIVPALSGYAGLLRLGVGDERGEHRAEAVLGRRRVDLLAGKLERDASARRCCPSARGSAPMT